MDGPFKLLTCVFCGIVGLWIRAAGVEDVQYSQVPCFLMEPRGVHEYMLCVPCGTCTLKLFHSCGLLHLQDRVLTNKSVSYSPRVDSSLTVMWQQQNIYIYKYGNKRSQSKGFNAKRPEGQTTAVCF